MMNAWVIAKGLLGIRCHLLIAKPLPLLGDFATRTGATTCCNDHRSSGHVFALAHSGRCKCRRAHTQFVCFCVYLHNNWADDAFEGRGGLPFIVGALKSIYLEINAGVRVRADLGVDQAGTAVQIAGREAYWMAEAARMVAANVAAMIDINMGCPAKKVTNGYSGSALMRDPDHALSLIEAVVDAVDIPVTLKTRLGWDDDCLNAPDLARRAQDAGIRDVKEAAAIPVFANGVIGDTATARIARDLSGADGVMVGRGAQGRPWALAQIAADLHGPPAPRIPKGPALIDMVCAHYQAMLSFYGDILGNKVARKHLGWYMDDAGTPSSLRKTVLTETCADTVLRLLPDALSQRAAA